VRELDTLETEGTGEALRSGQALKSDEPERILKALDAQRGCGDDASAHALRP
jgi:hypothetical protein